MQFIPRFAVMPTLFYVGLMIIADSFVSPQIERPPSFTFQGQPSLPTHRSFSARTPIGRTLYFVPAAVATVIVANTNRLDLAVAAGILSYMLITFLPEKFLGGHDKLPLQIGFIHLGAASVMIVNLVLL